MHAWMQTFTDGLGVAGELREHHAYCPCPGQGLTGDVVHCLDQLLSFSSSSYTEDAAAFMTHGRMAVGQRCCKHRPEDTFKDKASFAAGPELHAQAAL